MSQPSPDFLTVQEASIFLNVKQSYIRHLVFQKKIPHIKLNGIVRFSISELIAFVEKYKIHENPTTSVTTKRKN